MITYNHEKVISQAIEGVLMQKTSFPVELIIGEDGSKDNTKSICLDYQKKHDNLIKLRLQENNIGAIQNFIGCLNACKGKYIAFCEGDDYWTDPLKLQKQVDYLEAHPEISLCFHNAMIKYEGIKGKDHLFCDEDIKKVTTIEDVIKKWYIPSASMVFRNSLITPLPDWFNNIYNGDYALQLLLAAKGKVGYINDVMCVYRKNANALSGGIGKNYIYVNNKIIELLEYINKYNSFNYDDIVSKRITDLKHENKYLLIRKHFPIIKYFDINIWLRKFATTFRI